MRTDGTIKRFKARLVIKGFTQKKDIDYFDTYSLVTRIATIRALIALAAIHNLVVHQMDVKTTFLNGDLEEEIYMSQPEGFVIQGQENKVCKLKKSLYGLKEAPKQWCSRYVEKVLKKFNSFDVVHARTPYDSSTNSTKDVGESVSQIEYVKIIGSVMFLMNCARPDNAYVVSRLSLYTHNPSSSHWTTLHCLLKYLKGTSNVCLHFRKFSAVLEEYCDANWVSSNDEISSTSGYVFTLGSGAILWESTKHTCIARSTMESEFIALELAGEEADWLRNLLTDIPLWEKHGTLVFFHCDSQAPIGVAKNVVYNGKKRHIRIRHGVVRQLISLDYVKSERNLADLFRKGLTRKIILDTSSH
ncbi:transmembrane signal receptor [Lithospermum erythrorhizon]|uniref:Transmembrane signal receptor n=1 Tax=Lithospermum erythrorhizon TaxID=34254 RepID=A0AAV3R1G6_LITER